MFRFAHKKESFTRIGSILVVCTFIDYDPEELICVNGITGDDNVTCVCSPGYTGAVCDVPLIAECDVNPCQNGGNCSMVAGTPACECPEGFNGPTCASRSGEKKNVCLQWAVKVSML